MLFKSRHSPSWRTSVRLALWPRHSFGRSARYVGWRIVRLGGSAHGLALGVAIGVFVACIPVFGIQLVLAGLMAWMLRANVPAALLGTFWANPMSLPILWFSSYWLGTSIIGEVDALTAAELLATLDQLRLSVMTPGRQTLSAVYDLLWPIWRPLLIGAVPVGLVCAGFLYALTYNLIGGYRVERRRPARANTHRVRGLAVRSTGDQPAAAELVRGA